MALVTYHLSEVTSECLVICPTTVVARFPGGFLMASVLLQNAVHCPGVTLLGLLSISFSHLQALCNLYCVGQVQLGLGQESPLDL